MDEARMVLRRLGRIEALGPLAFELRDLLRSGGPLEVLVLL